jgi:hypothetical protein
MRWQWRWSWRRDSMLWGESTAAASGGAAASVQDAGRHIKEYREAADRVVMMQWQEQKIAP